MLNKGEHIVLKKYSRLLFLIVIGLLIALLLLSAPAAHGAQIDPDPGIQNQPHAHNWP